MISPLVSYFGSELRRAREALGLTQRQLAEAVLYSESKVGAVERGEQLPAPAFCERADECLKTEGRFTRMREKLLSTFASPDWFLPWVDYERIATEIRWHEPLLIPGLLQIEDYARALLLTDDPEETESRVAARMERQQIFHRERPPLVTVVIDESVLTRLVVSPRVMHAQLMHLTTVRAVMQVLPTSADTHLHLEGSFALATVDGVEVAYVDTPARGFVLDRPEVVSRLKQSWEIIRAEALPRKQSQALILEVAERWKQQQ